MKLFKQTQATEASAFDVTALRDDHTLMRCNNCGTVWSANPPRSAASYQCPNGCNAHTQPQLANSST